MQLPIPHPVHLFLVVDMVANGPSGGLMLDGDLLAYCSMAICPFTGLFLVAIHIRKPTSVLRSKASRRDDRWSGARQ